MVKYIRKKFPGIARRSKSNAVTENLPPEVYLGPDHRMLGQRPVVKRRSYSFCQSPKTNQKKRVMRRIVRTKFEADHNELMHMLSDVTNGVAVKRRMDDELEDVQGRLEMGRTDSFMENELENSIKPSIPWKSNRFTAISPILFQCSRTSQTFPCFPESDVLKIPIPLATLFHQGVREEDCDSTDSIVERGVNNCMIILGQALGIRVSRSFASSKKTTQGQGMTDLCAEEFDPTILAPKYNG